MKLISALLIMFCLVGCASSLPAVDIMQPTPTETTAALTAPETNDFTIPLPTEGSLFHGVYPGGINGAESDITLADKRSYEEATGKKTVWIYFSHNWFEGREFPTQTATWIREDGSIPYIRLMLRSSAEQGIAEPLFTLQSILDSEYDYDLNAWCQAARDFDSPILAEFGTEMNGEWFSWNGIWNGASTLDGYGDAAVPDGPERFRDAYRKIITNCRSTGADNITWVFHLNGSDQPEEDWNRFENYYPGDEYIDWLAISIYGAQTPQESNWEEFADELALIYPRVLALSPTKPIIIAEFGVTLNNPSGNQAAWARAALQEITSLRYPHLIGFSWWNERWQNDDNPAHDTTMRLQDNPGLEEAFTELVGNNPQVLSSAAQK